MRKALWLSLALAVLAHGGPRAAGAAAPKDRHGLLEGKEFFRPELAISTEHVALEQIEGRLPNREAWARFRDARPAGPGAPGWHAYIDPRSGAISNLLGAFPLIPGDGAGNPLTLESLRQSLDIEAAAVDEEVVARALRAFVDEHRRLLNIEVAQLGPPRVARVRDDLWQFSFPQVAGGVPVRHGRLAGTLVKGNLVVLGAESWGDVRIDTAPRLGAKEAIEKGFAYAEGRIPQDEILQKPTLEIVPFAPPRGQDGPRFQGPVGSGYAHRLVWAFVFRRPPDQARWEVLVDAQDGEVVSFQDLNHYVQRQVSGGVYPLTNTQICPGPLNCGTLQPGWPMPFADTGLPSPNNFTNSAGVFDWTSGTVTTTLTGRFVDIVDNCGAVSESSGSGNINMGGTNGQHDCASGGASAGNTASARSAFYEVNKLAELARGWLPSNTWLQSRLTSNMNLPQNCNAFWNGSSINFYRSGGGCGNTGEIAGVFDHEWGHGLDDNDANGVLSNSSEAYADIAAIYRLQTSCVGHGFFTTLDQGCGSTADGTGMNSNENQVGGFHCDLDCSGVRDADWAKHSPSNPDTALGFVCNECTGGPGPCGRQVHCAAAPSRQAAWDLVARDLQSAPFNLDSQTAFIVGNKLFYQGSGNIGAWHACTCGSSSSGCGATNAYMQWLAADDDNGNVGDGTPHMTAIHAAFNRHGIACATPAPVNRGCSAGPSAAPTVSGSAGNFSASLSWSAVAGASRYWVFRSEGHAGCNFGKALVAETTATSFTDTQVANGRAYSYNVVAAGASSACFGRASNCLTLTPAPGAGDFSLACNPSSLSVAQGGQGTSTCTVTSTGGFSGAVDLGCANTPAGVSCAFNPDPVTPPANGAVNSTLTLSVAAATAPASYTIQVQGVSGSTTRSTNLGLTVTPSGGGGTAIFDPALQAPKCGSVGSSCDSGSLLLGRDNVSGGPEPNQPNTIGDSCADGGSGSFHSDESNDRIRVATTDGSNFAPGKTVRIEATAWAWTTPSADRLDLYYAANANSPAWTYITTLTPTAAGAQTLSATYTLPTGALQAVRARFRYQGGPSPCATGAFDDHDDLAFSVSGSGGGTVVLFDQACGLVRPGDVSISCDPSSDIPGTRFDQSVPVTFQAGDTVSVRIHNVDDHAFVHVNGTLAASANYGEDRTVNISSFFTPGSNTLRFVTTNDGFTPWCYGYRATLTPAGATPRGIKGDYFNNRFLTAPPALTRTDPTVNFTWGAGSPDPALNFDGFSVRWTGQLEPAFSEPYTFHVFSDDGFRLWVNNVLLIDRWFDQFGPEVSSAPINLVAGQRYDIKVEYYENAGGAEIHLSWSSPSTPKQVIPQDRLTPAP